MIAADTKVDGLLPVMPHMRILIADDRLVSRLLLEATLRKWNYDVVVA